jgi:hypothetical protein
MVDAELAADMLLLTLESEAVRPKLETLGAELAMFIDGFRWSSRIPCARASMKDAWACLYVSVFSKLRLSEVPVGVPGGDSGRLILEHAPLGAPFLESCGVNELFMTVIRPEDAFAYLRASQRDKEHILDLRPCLELRRM